MRLRFESGPMRGQEVVIEADITLGRMAGNGIVLADPTVSAYHARIVLRDGVAWIEDTGSANGISINGHAIAVAALRSGLSGRAGRFHIMGLAMENDYECSQSRCYRILERA